MHHHELKKIIEKRFEKIKKDLEKLPFQFAADDVHEFRVEIKKLRAFIRLLQTEMPGLKIPKSLKKIYRNLGAIRNLQLQQNFTDQFALEKKLLKSAVYLKILNDEEQHFHAIAEEKINDHDMHDDETKLAGEMPEILQKTSIKKYTEEKLSSFFTIIKELESNDRWHDLRKLLKDIFYNRKYISEYSDKLFPAYFNRRNLHSFTNLLGDLQDTYTSLTFLQPFYFDRVNEEAEKKFLHQMETHLKTKQRGLKARILRRVNKMKNFSETPGWA